ncbi:hypothetical protein AWV80_05080 [Cupriavidus sp. UYMU48A]|nr:hypothetical protein AWV80_05080 [Cupriavidus sp. UYMU48A]
MNPAENLDDLSPQQLRELAATLRAQIQEQDAVIARHAQELRYRQTKIDLTLSRFHVQQLMQPCAGLRSRPG